jgi:Family of unknown function (DUF5706)
MDIKQQLEIAKNQLNIVLSFFPRVDAQASVILAINTAMIATLTSNAPNLKSFECYMLFSLLPALSLISLSICNLYFLAYPRLKGPTEKSVIYFAQISENSLDEYQTMFFGLTEEEYIKDLLGQIWRNAEILNKKYKHLSLAFNFLVAALIPWMVSLAIFSSKSLEIKTLLVK